MAVAEGPVNKSISRVESPRARRDNLIHALRRTSIQSLGPCNTASLRTDREQMARRWRTGGTIVSKNEDAGHEQQSAPQRVKSFLLASSLRSAVGGHDQSPAMPSVDVGWRRVRPPAAGWATTVPVTVAGCVATSAMIF